MKLRVPHTLVLLFGMIVLAQICTYLLPKGAYEKESKTALAALKQVDKALASGAIKGSDGAPISKADREKIVSNAESGILGAKPKTVPGSYKPLPEAKPLPWYHLFIAIPKGFEHGQGIIFFIFIIGGAFAVFRRTGAADATIGLLLDKLGHSPAMLVFGGMLVFTLGSSYIGMAEEYIPFVPVLIALCLGLKFDAIVAVGILYCGCAIGYGMAMVNPFTVIPAQNIAGIPETSGQGFRALMTVPFLAIGFHHVYRYARRIHADPAASLVADVDYSDLDEASPPAFTAVHAVLLGLVVGAIALLVWGIKAHGWYLAEMGAIFLGLTVLMAIIARISPDETAKAFCTGAAELATTALLIGFAYTIEVVLRDGQVIDTIIHVLATSLEQLGAGPAAIGMFLTQSACNFFVPSGSGQAYVTMPIMSPLAREIGLDQQIAVLAYQMGDGFTNIIVPTNAVLIGVLTIARIPYDRWFRFIFPFMIKVWIAGAIVLLIAHYYGHSLGL